MSSSNNINVNESPNHFMILDAIARGMTNISKIAKVTKINNNGADIELIVNDLLTQRLIVKSEVRGFLGRKKAEIRITETGLRLLNTKKRELEQKFQDVQQWYNNGDRSKLETFMDSNRVWIPMMLFSGIMNTMFFMSMMSLMGMAMNPAENAAVGSHGDQNTQSGAQDNDNNNNSSQEQTDQTATEPTADYSNVGDSAGFEGFDGGGGFDNF
ncbi:MAG TPA: MarR family transcriptional regulator [Nitrososphaeraceae archaeon]|jgi:DNA-binding PadR family transcriptional regulator